MPVTEKRSVEGKPVERTVAVVIRNPEAPGAVLAVLRPQDDPDLPGTWGLPAATLHPGESFEGAGLRAGRQKLGVDLAQLRSLRQGAQRRGERTIEMRLYEAQIARGSPAVPQRYPAVTQYAAWRWTNRETFRSGAAAGSLCCRLFLEHEEGSGARSP